MTYIQNPSTKKHKQKNGLVSKPFFCLFIFVFYYQTEAGDIKTLIS